MQRTDYSQQGAGYTRDRRYSGGRNDAAYGSGIRREENYRSEKHLNQGKGEASSSSKSNDSLQSPGGRNEGQNDNERPDQQEKNHNGDGDDFSGAAKHANQHAGSSADSNIFSSVLAALGQNRQSLATQNVDEQDAVNSHQQYFGGNGNPPSQATSESMGSAAAMQALKLFLGNGNQSQQGDNQQGNEQQGHNQNQIQGNPQDQFIGMALAEASKLFDQQSSQGNVQSGTSKQSVVQHAGEMALKMYLKGQGGSGASGLLGKFL